MAQIVTSAWMFSALLLYAGVAVAVAGVAIFGWHFVGANARAAQDQVGSRSAVAWGGAGARRGFKVAALGGALHLSGFLLGRALSGLA